MTGWEPPGTDSLRGADAMLKREYEGIIADELRREAELLDRLEGPRKRRRRWCLDVRWWPRFERTYDDDFGGEPAIVFGRRRFRFGPWVDEPQPVPERYTYSTITMSGVHPLSRGAPGSKPRASATALSILAERKRKRGYFTDPEADPDDGPLEGSEQKPPEAGEGDSTGEDAEPHGLLHQEQDDGGDESGEHRQEEHHLGEIRVRGDGSKESHD